MATLYIDFENGNDIYGGTSFAPLAQGTDGRVTSTTFSSATASFPNDGSLIGQYISVFNGTFYVTWQINAWLSSTSLTIGSVPGGSSLTNQVVDRQYYIGGRWKNITTGAVAARTNPGDTIRIMGSPAPTSLGQNGVWTSQALQATKSITGATNATPIAITCTGHGYSTGDTVVVTGVGGNTNANGTWEITSTGANTFTLDGSAGNAAYTSGGTARLRNNTRVKLTTAVTQNIASTGPGRTAWTASANVTASLEASFFKEHTRSDAIVIGAGFTTGLAAYQTLPSALNLSGYQQVSFWIRQPAGGAFGANGAIDLRLCSDTLGTTAVNTISIPGSVTAGRWTPVTVDLGTNLGSSIQSIALYVNTDNGAQTFQFSNIIACKASSAADSLTLTSLIGKNTTGETFWGIQSINGTRVMLDADTQAVPNSTSVRGYYGTSETVTTWKRETIKLGPADSSTTALQTIQESGTDGSPITYSGGWDRTAMSTQNLETWLDGVNGNGQVINYGALSFLSTTNLAFVRCNAAESNVNFSTISWIAANNCTGTYVTGTEQLANLRNTITVGHSVANAGTCMRARGPSNKYVINYLMGSSGNEAIRISATYDTRIEGGTASASLANNATYGLNRDSNAGDVYVKNLFMADNASAAIQFTTSYGANVYLQKCNISDATEVLYSQSNAPASVFSQNHDNTVDNHKIFMDGALVSSATDQRHTASGISWKMQPTSTNRCSVWPVTLSLAKVACSANNLVTIKAWMRRDNAGLTMRLVCKGGQIAGVASDVVSALSTTNAWEEETITFTPTETGVVEITAEAWGGTTFSGWVDDMTISQA